MECREIFDRLSEYIDRELDPSLCDEIENHIKDCEPCVAFINTLKKTVELFNKELPSNDIPKPVSANLHEFLKKELDA
ncbi:hypothetical protein MNBD_NITROSPINAE01-1067 [hydrothermal vent metagenome]|uniref:Putative zinc-finger domain-containing protein n=1 Tax=hydrothermal vent metagenome TaxID=652676 RepID=A0A3B1BPE9_9ZZZZ